ncbi:TPA: hypothetical protein N0F65_010169 [Lagenidium giganteum]|uniref:GOLD domain-containing protein n=1 Tax=Lagenidium giganteum TaxID=4803 RepID=A0AAV2Z898_9STRA|nr:TPA: hypothetical protein N0F65_010169 [Lagenidium giganteum]
MTRRAKEKRTARAQEKQRAAERELREQALAFRPEWKQLLAAIDGTGHPAASKLGKPSAPIVDTLQWKSSLVPIAAADVLQLPIKLDAQKGVLQYEFSTRDYDITFAVQMICADGTMIELLEPKRFDSQKAPVKGRLELVGPGMVLLIWDNSFSWVNPKQLAYSVELHQDVPIVAEEKKVARALAARRKREALLMQQEQEVEMMEDIIKYEEKRTEDVQKQIAELELVLQQSQESKAKAMAKHEQLELRIEELEWEIKALSWRSFDPKTLGVLLSYLEPPTLQSLSLANKKWFCNVREFINSQKELGRESANDDTAKRTAPERVPSNAGELHRDVDPATSSQAA